MARGDKGQLGLGSRIVEADFAMGASRPRLSRPRKVKRVNKDGNGDALDGVDVKAIEVEAAYGHTLVKTDDGCIFSCGSGDDGATGHGDTEIRWVLQHVEGVPIDPAVTRAAEAADARR